MRRKDGIQAERLLLDSIQRLRKRGGGGQAVHLHLSRLLPMNRLPVRMRVVTRMFKGLETGHGAQVYRLSTDDIIIIGRTLPREEIELIIHRVRSLFEHDPMSYAGKGQDDPDDPFVTWYDLLLEHKVLTDVVQGMEDARLSRLGSVGAGAPTSAFTWSTPADAGPDPIDPRALGRALEALQEADLAPHVRRQPAVRITEDRQARIAFEEFFVSIGNLQKAVAPNTVLTADRWLFQDFSRALDRRVMDLLGGQALLTVPGAVSLNLNLESTRTPTFQRLVRRLKGTQKLIVEVQVIDVFADIAAYEDTRDALREAGHELVIDGLSPATLRLLDVSRLDPDYAKVLWNADLAREETAGKTATFAAEVQAAGPQRVVLARCDTETSVLWGLANGVRLFQGRFMDAVLATVTMEACPAAERCSLSQCAGRRSSVAGTARLQCPHPPGLDAVQQFAAPGTRSAFRRNEAAQ